MLSTGEMCLLLPNNIRSNLCSLMNLNPLCLLNNNTDFKGKLRTNRSASRSLFNNITDSINNNDEKQTNNIDFAEKLLNEQLNIDREHFINRYDFDILDESFDESYSDMSSFASSEVTPIRDPKIRLDENVNEINSSNENICPVGISSEGETDEFASSPEPSKPLSPTKNRTSVESRRHPYAAKKQTHVTDFWKIRRRSLEVSPTSISEKSQDHLKTSKTQRELKFYNTDSTIS